MTSPIIPLPSDVDQLLQRLGVPHSAYTGGTLAVRSPISGDIIGQLPETSPEQATAAIDRAQAAFQVWRDVPAPR
jgi:aldehyde dehydrogenase (NAD+)